MKKNEVMKTNSTEDILLRQKNDRRMLSYVPDKKNVRDHVDRRGSKKVQSLEVCQSMEGKMAEVQRYGPSFFILAENRKKIM